MIILHFSNSNFCCKQFHQTFAQLQQGSLYYQPKQCTIIRENPQNYRTFTSNLIPPPKWVPFHDLCSTPRRSSKMDTDRRNICITGCGLQASLASGMAPRSNSLTHDGSTGFEWLPIHEGLTFYGINVGKYTIHGCYGKKCSKWDDFFLGECYRGILLVYVAKHLLSKATEKNSAFLLEEKHLTSFSIPNYRQITNKILKGGVVIPLIFPNVP